MIAANELRMGNWVKDSLGYLVIGVNAKVEFASAYEPIPLTPEILEKCGFAFKPTGEEVYEQIWSIDVFEIWEHDSGFCHDFHYGGDVKHLHQLQNLYFALTGEELNYTP